MERVATTFRQQLDVLWGSLVERLPYVCVALIVFALFLLLARIGRRTLEKLGTRAHLHGNLIELFGRIGSFVLTILGLFVAATVIFPGFRPSDLIAGLGITTVAIGFAFKDILQNFFAGILILWRRPFQVGDEICTGEFEGVVEEINSRSTRIRTYDGERAIIPNGDIYTSPILVRTAYPSRRLSVGVGIAYDASLDTARSVVLRALQQVELVLPEPGPWVLVSRLADSAVELTIYFWVEARTNTLLARSEVATAVKSALDTAGIEIPFPQLVIQRPHQEGSAQRA